MYNFCVRKFYGCHPGDDIWINTIQDQDALIDLVQSLNNNSIKANPANFKRKKLWGQLDPQTLCVARFEVHTPTQQEK